MHAVDDLLAAGRAAAEALMVDQCTITAPGAGRTWDESTGDWVYPPPVVVYQGPCKVQTADRQTGNPVAGERVWSVNDAAVHLPVVGSEGVQAKHTVTVTAAVHDPALMGRVFTVSGPHVGSLKTARRLPCEGVT